MSLAAATSSQLLRPSSLGCGAPQRQPRLGAATQLLPQQRRAGRLVPRTAEPAAPAQPADTRSAAELVDFVLGKIEGTDGGDRISPTDRQAVDAALTRLDEIGEAKAERPLEDPLVFGNYAVDYVSAGPSQYGAPAGGRFRSGLGKLLFRTVLLAQSVLKPDIVTNKVEFRLLGFIPGSVGLRGRFVSIPEREGGEDRKDTVKVFFEPPVLSLGKDIHIRTGPPSSVVLKTTYVDERVRLGKGSRGSLFVFTRGGAADAAGMDQVGLQQNTPLGKVILWGLVAALMGNGAWLASRGTLPPVIRAAGIVQVLLGLALGGVVQRGGIVQDNEDRPEVAQPGSS